MKLRLNSKATLGQNGSAVEVGHGVVVIAAITSCTNTSNPSVMIGAGLLAKKASSAGLDVKPYVKTSLAPGSRVVTEYLDKAGLDPLLASTRFLYRWLWLHDLYRKQRPTAGKNCQRDQGKRIWLQARS